MPDGEINVRIIADTSGADKLTTAAQRMAAELARTGGNLGRIDAQFVETGQRAGQAAAALGTVGQAAQQSATQLGAVGTAAPRAGSEAASGMEHMRVGTAGAYREIVVLGHEMMQGRFSRIPGSIMVLAERMGSLDTIVGALKGPFGIAVAAAAALGVAFVVLARQASQAAAEIREVSSAAALQGRDVGAAVASAQRYTAMLSASGMMGQSAARTVGDAIAKIPNITDQVRDRIVAIGEALTQQLGGNATKAGELIGRAFGSISGLAKFADTNNLMTDSTVQAVAKQKGAIQAYLTVLDIAQARLSGYANAVKQAQKDSAASSEAVMRAGLESPGLSAVPSTFFPLQFPQGATGPTPQQRQTQNDVQANSQQYVEQNELLRQQKEIQASIANGEAQKVGNLDQAKAALTEITTKLADLQKKEAGPGALGVMEGLSEKLKEQDAAIAGTAKTAKAAREAMLANDQKYWSAVLAGEKLSAQQRAEVQMRLFSAKEAGEIGALPSGRSGGGGRGAANQDYEAFAEGERNKIEAARGSASQISAVYDEWLARAAALYGQDSAQYRRVELEKANAAREGQRQVAESAEQSYSAQRSADTSYLASFKANMAAMAAAHKITKQQMYGFDIEYTAQLRDELKKQLQAIIDNDNLAKADRQRAWNEMLEMEAEFNTRAIEEQAKAAEAMSLTWEQSIKQMSDQFADMTADVLLRTKTIKQAFDELVKSMLTDTLKSGFKGLFDSLLFGSGGTGSGGGGGGGGGGGAGGIAGDLFGGLGRGLLKMLGGDAASGLIGNPFTAGAGGLLGGSLSGLGGLFGGGATDAWGGIGAASASAGGGGLLSGIGGLFTGLFGLLGFEHGGIVPSAAGGWSVPSLGPGGVLAQLHSQEMVLPAGISGGLQSMIANGGGGHTFNIGVNAVDAGGVAKLFSSNGGALVQALNNALRHGSALYQS